MSGFFIKLVVPDKASVHAWDGQSKLSTSETDEPAEHAAVTRAEISSPRARHVGRPQNTGSERDSLAPGALQS
jgi:hypothetical protein